MPNLELKGDGFAYDPQHPPTNEVYGAILASIVDGRIKNSPWLDERSWSNDRIVETFISSDAGDAHGDTIPQTALAKAMPWYMENGYYEWQHSGFPIGKAIAWRIEDGKIKIRVGIYDSVHSNNPAHDEAWNHIKRYGTRGMSSIKGSPNAQRKLPGGLRELSDMSMWGVGWVGDSGANPMADVTSVSIAKDFDPLMGATFAKQFDAAHSAVEKCGHIDGKGLFVAGREGCIAHMMGCKGHDKDTAEKMCAHVGQGAEIESTNAVEKSGDAGTLGAVLTGHIHQAYTVYCDELVKRGLLSTEQRIAVGKSIGDALRALTASIPADVAAIAVLENHSLPASSPPEGVAIDKKQEEKAMPNEIKKEEPAGAPPPGAAPPNGGDMEGRVAALEKQVAELMAAVSKGVKKEDPEPVEEQKNAEVETLRKANEEMKKQLSDMDAKVKASVQKSKGVAVDNTPNSDGQPSLLMTPVMKALETMTVEERLTKVQAELRAKGGK